jgi:histidine triad (HIT) family protein
MQDCIFCKIAQGEIPSSTIWGDEKFLAFLDINPVNPGHTLLIPKKHIDNVFEMEDRDYSDLFLAAKLLSKPLQAAMGAKRVGVMIEGFLVHHAHIHLIPLKHGNGLDPCRAKKATPEELAEVAKKIKAHL